MVQLCRMTGCRIGLITNGERWMLVDSPVGAVTSFASWYARFWSQEPVTLQAFVHLLGIRRFFFDKSEQLPALFDQSLKYQDEVTESLGEQVRRAVEVLIQSLDKADQDRNRELLHDVKEPELYEAALTVMMRLVFLLSAEERGLLLMGDECYEANYAISTLRMQLRTESEEILERRWDAWSRLLAIFRAVFGGIEHENLRLPALGGSLFDPDRFPFLEGRAKGSNWHTDAAKPLPIDNRTVLLLLEAIQQFHGRTLSYRALDVEQIGYVYEGLLERTVKRTSEVTLELDATKSADSPWVTLGELESTRLDRSALTALLQERSGCSASRIRNDLSKVVDDVLADRLLTTCQADTALRDRIKPYAHLLRVDPWGYPLVYPKGAFIVTTGSDRRETGTHYTPKSLTEAIVAETLTPIAYVGPSEGKPREEWVLKSPAELLDLKICDPAMGSGAFLVQACRWLSDRLVEAWSLAEKNGQFVTVDSNVSTDVADAELLPRDAEARIVIARRLIAERCLYGVDLNPLAVELAKLSIWLVTLAKGRPFGFLDHNLRCGNSLLGIFRLDQLTELTMTPGGKGQQRLFGRNIEQAVQEAMALRLKLRKIPIRDIHDVAIMERLNDDAGHRLKISAQISDALIGEVFSAGGNGKALEAGINILSVSVELALEGDVEALTEIVSRTQVTLYSDQDSEKLTRRLFHWPLEFPEVFEKLGFDAIIGNPPFIPITGIECGVRRFIESQYATAIGRHNTFSSFAERALAITSDNASIGLVVPDRLFLNVQYEILRKMLLERLKFSHIFDFAGAFNATVDAIAIIGHKKRAIDTIKVCRTKKEANSPEIRIFSQNSLLSAYEGAINIYVEPEDANIYSQVKGQSIPLGDIADVKDGIIQGMVADLLFIEANEDEFSKKLLFGGDINRYAVHWNGNYVNYAPEKLMKHEIERRGPNKRPGLWMRNSGIFEKRKIVTRQTSDRIIAAIDNNNYYYANTLHGTSLPEDSLDQGFTLEYVLALLNSKLLNFIYAVITGEVGKVFAQIKIDTLKKMPIFVDPNNATSVKMKLLSEKLTNENHENIKPVCQEIDRLVYDLYGLSDESVSYIEKRYLELYGQ